MRSPRFLQDLQFGLGFEDYFWSKNRSPNCNILRFTLFCKISSAPCWLHLRDNFLFNVCMSKMSFIHSFVHSINQHYFEGLLRWNQCFIQGMKISHPPPYHFLAIPTGPSAANWATRGCVADVSESTSPILNCWYHPPSQNLSSRLSQLKKWGPIYHWLKLKPGRHSWHFFNLTPKSNPAPRELLINIDQRNGQVVEWEGEWVNNALSCLYLPFQPLQECLLVSWRHSWSNIYLFV